MADRSTTGTAPAAADQTRRIPALAAGIGLLAMAILAPIAQFGVLQSLVVPDDAAATVANIAASSGSFWGAIGAFAVVAILDVVVAWGLYGLLRPANERLAQVVAGLRVVYAATFAYTLVHLVNAAQLVGGASGSSLQSEQLRAGVASSIGSFNDGWHLALGIFGLHLAVLALLLLRFGAPRVLAALVAVAGGGYLVDAIGNLVSTDYTLTISTYTFIGEVLLIVWLIWIAIKGVRSPGQIRVDAEGEAAVGVVA